MFHPRQANEEGKNILQRDKKVAPFPLEMKFPPFDKGCKNQVWSPHPNASLWRSMKKRDQNQKKIYYLLYIFFLNLKFIKFRLTGGAQPVEKADF